jgi:hypothetical protein
VRRLAPRPRHCKPIRGIRRRALGVPIACKRLGGGSVRRPAGRRPQQNAARSRAGRPAMRAVSARGPPAAAHLSLGIMPPRTQPSTPRMPPGAGEKRRIFDGQGRATHYCPHLRPRLLERRSSRPLRSELLFAAAAQPSVCCPGEWPRRVTSLARRRSDGSREHIDRGITPEKRRSSGDRQPRSHLIASPGAPSWTTEGDSTLIVAPYYPA